MGRCPDILDQALLMILKQFFSFFQYDKIETL